MKVSRLNVAFIASMISLVLVVLVFGFLNNFEFSNLNILVLIDIYVELVTAFVGNFDLADMTNLVLVGGTALGLVLGLIALIRALFVKRFMSGLIAFVAIFIFSALVVSFIMPSETLAGQTYLSGLMDGLSNQLVDTLLLIVILGLIFVTLLLLFLLGLTVKSKPTSNAIPVIPLTPSINANAANPSASVPTPSPASQQDTLSELVKVVMQEELAMMRNSQPTYGIPAMAPANPYASTLDLNLVKRIVVEELAKLQGQFISRAEVQALIAQEITFLQAQLKRK